MTWLIAGGVVLVLATQLWSAVAVASRTSELRRVLSEGHASASLLERRIGYGGLIHHFKNYVLRPDEDDYRTAALADAEAALSLLERLRANAGSLGIEASLDATREMVESYSRRLERVRELSAGGRDPRFVDERVRFDDAPALREVAAVISRLDAVVDDRLLALQREGTITTLLSTACTAAIGGLLAGVVARRQRRHVESVGALADTLAESNADLARANVSLGQFAGIVSHDLKTPLRHINVFSEMVVEDRADAEAVELHVRGINRLVGKMESIVESLLDFTRTGFAKPRLQPIDLAGLFADIERDLAPELDGGARLVLDMPPDVPLRADPELLTRLFANLIGNSLKYARDDVPARVVVRVRIEDERVVCSVSDNGIGIEPRFAERIFEPLQRLHGPQSSYEGVGIGLSLARSIAESHGGTLRLDTGVTHGTRIVCTLPHESRLAPGEAA